MQPWQQVIRSTISECTAEVIPYWHFSQNWPLEGLQVLKHLMACGNTAVDIRSRQREVLKMVVPRQCFTTMSGFGHAR